MLIGNRFEVLLDDLVGEGGIAQVFRGQDLETGRPVAAKRLRPELAGDEEATRRFEREQRISSIFDHSNIVRYLDAADGWLFLDLVDGQTLKRLLAEQGPVDLEQSVRIMRGSLRGLDHMHRRGIVHLDIKPQNIMLTRNREVRLIDLGLAHEFADEQIDRLGTAAYIAPEQIDRGPVDGRTDIYALGCVFYELVTGRPPFVAPGLTGDAEQRHLLDAHRFDQVVPPSRRREGLPAWLDDVIGRALEKEPDNRFVSSMAMQGAIDRGLGLTPARPRTEATVTPPAAPAEERTPVAGDTGPSTLTRFAAWAGNLLWVLLRRFARLPLRLNRWSAILAASLILVMVINLPVVSDMLLEQAIEVVPWTGTTVQADGLYFRANPGSDGEILAGLASGTKVSITGLPEDRDGITWWPVLVAGERGWVAGTYLAETFLMSTVQFPDDARDFVGGLADMVVP